MPVGALEGYSLVTVEGQLLIYGDDPPGRRDHPFAAMLLNGPDGNPLGAAGWWFNPRAFLAAHLRDVVLERLTSGRGMYGGLTLTRQLVDAMGGQLEVSSRVGIGSTFTVRLPTAPRTKT